MTREIPLTKGLVAIVDDEDFLRVSTRKWHAYACGNGWRARATFAPPKRNVLLHRFILGLSPQDSRTVDHINGDGLDCRRSNLRACAWADNNKNRRPRDGRKFKGIFTLRGRFGARIAVDGTRFSLGVYATEIEAAIAYDAAARRYHGAFARLNFPIGPF